MSLRDWYEKHVVSPVANRFGFDPTNNSMPFNSALGAYDQLFPNNETYNPKLNEMEIDENLLTGFTDVDLDYLRQLYLTNVANEYNSNLYDKYLKYQLDLANSAYQRQAQDLEASGYNRALVLGHGGASSSISGPIDYQAVQSPNSGRDYSLKMSKEARKNTELTIKKLKLVIDGINSVSDLVSKFSPFNSKKK